MKNGTGRWRPAKLLNAEWRGLMKLAREWGEPGRPLRLTDVVRRLLALEGESRTPDAEQAPAATGTEGRL